VNSLPKTVARQRRDCDLNPGPTAPESSTLTTRLPSHPTASTLYTTQKPDKINNANSEIAREANATRIDQSFYTRQQRNQSVRSAAITSTVSGKIRRDTIRDAILSCARKSA